MLRDTIDAALRQVIGNGCFAFGTLAIATTTTAFKTTSAISYAIDGVMYTKAATDNVVLTALPKTGAVGTMAVHGPSQSRYYAVMIDAAGNLTTKQGADGGPVPSPTPEYENGLAYARRGGVVSTVTRANPAVVTTSANHLLNTGDTFRLDGLQSATGASGKSMSELNGRAFKVKRTGATTLELFTLEGEPVDTTAFGALTSTGNWMEDEIARAVIGAIKVTTDGSTTFTPGTTALSAAGLTTTYFNFGPGGALLAKP